MTTISSLRSPSSFNTKALAQKAPEAPSAAKSKDDGELRKAFDTFVGEVFFGQMLSSMRKTVGKPAYFHGGRGEEVFQGQLDQVLAGKLTEASASQFTGPMFNLFQLSRS
jgi:flagellar protein FlgJ